VRRTGRARRGGLRDRPRQDRPLEAGAGPAAAATRGARLTDVVATARRIGDELLFPAAAATDASPIVAAENLDALAAAGLYGLEADLATTCAVIEELAGACLTTTFVWVQHLGVVLAVSATDTPGLADEWLGPLRRGERRAGIALAGAQVGSPRLRARAVEGGWILDGDAPWVTGWARIDVVHTAARDADGNLVLVLVDAVSGPGLEASSPLDLVAVRASSTVRLSFHEHFVPAARVTAVRPPGPPAGDREVLRIHSALPLGVATRCCRLLGATPLDGELVACRQALDEATGETIAAARAAASELAVRASAALVAASGSGSLLRDQHPQRLAREALFLLVFGGRPAVRADLLVRFGA
jgi:alkylation response protein AidB-like acyl-CoA dehydrogenase